MKLHLPLMLRKALLATFASALVLSTASTSSAENWDFDGMFCSINGGRTRTFNEGETFDTTGVTGCILIGEFSKGEVCLNGGTWTMNDKLVSIGYQGGTGVLRVKQGTYNMIGEVINIGQKDGRGSIIVEGGSLAIANEVNMGFGGNGTGSFEISGGTLTTNGLVKMGDSGTAAVNISGGTWDAAGGMETHDSSVKINLQGGTFKIAALNLNDKVFNWTRGTLETAGTIDAGASFTLNSGMNFKGTLTAASESTLVLESGAVVTLSSGSTVEGRLSNNGTVIVESGVNIDNLTLVSNTGTLVLTADSSLLTKVSTGTIGVAEGTYSINFAGDISLKKTGAGTATLTGSNTYLGGTEFAEGVLVAHSLGTGSLTFTGGIWQLSGNVTLAQGQGITVNDNTTATITLDNYSLNVAAVTALNGDLNITGGGGNMTFTGNVIGNGNLTETGSGDLTLGGANSIGTLTSDGGKLILNHVSALGGSGAMTFNGDSVLELGADISNSSRSVTAGTQAMTVTAGTHSLTLGDFTSSSLTKTGTGKMTVGALNTGVISTIGGLSFHSLAGSGDITLTGDATLENEADLTTGRRIVTAGHTLTLAHGSNTAAYNGAVTGNGNLTETGSGDLTLGGANSIGTFTSDGGKLILNHASALGGSGAMTFNGASELELGTDISNSSRSVTAGTNAMTVIAGTHSLTLGQFISGDMVKTGTGSLVLNATGNSMDAITFEGGLTLGSLNNKASGITLSGDGQLTLAAMNLDQRDLNLANHNLQLIITGDVDLGSLNKGTGTLTVKGAHKISFANAASNFADLTIAAGQTQEYRTGNVVVSNTLTMGAGSHLLALGGGIDVKTLALAGAGNSIEGQTDMIFHDNVSVDSNNGNTSLVSKTSSITFEHGLDTAGANTIVTANTNITLGGGLTVSAEAATAQLTATTGSLNVTGAVQLSAASKLTAGTTMTLGDLTGLNANDIKLSSGDNMTFTDEVSITGARVKVISTNGSLVFNDDVIIAGSINEVALTADNGEVTIEKGLERSAGDVATSPLVRALNDISISLKANILGPMTLTSTAGKLLFSSITTGKLVESVVSTLQGTEFSDTKMAIEGGSIAGPSLVAEARSDIHMKGVVLTGTPDLNVRDTSKVTMNRMTAALGDVTLDNTEDNEFLVNGGSALTASTVTVADGHLNVTAESSLNVADGIFLNGGTSLVDGGSTLTGDVVVTGGGDVLPANAMETIKDRTAAFTLTGLNTKLTGSLTIGGVNGEAGSARISSLAAVSGNVSVTGAAAWLELNNATVAGDLTINDSNLYVTGKNNNIGGNVTLSGASKLNIYDGVFSLSSTLSLGTGSELNIAQLDNVGGITGGEFIGNVIVDGGTINLRKSGRITGEVFFGSTVADLASGTMNVTDNTTWITESDITFSQNGILNIAAGSSVELKGNANLNGAGNLIKNGQGELIINTTNSAYAGNLLLQEGSLTLGATGALGDTGTLKAAEGTSLKTTADASIDKDLQLDGSAFSIDTASTLQWTGAVTLADSASSHVLTKEGMGNLVLTDATLNDVQVNKGTLTLDTEDVSMHAAILADGASLVSRGTIATLTGTANNTILINGGTITGTATQAGGTLNVHNGTLDTVSTNGTVITVDGSSTLGVTVLTGGSLSMSNGTLASLTTQTAAANANLTGVSVTGLVTTVAGDLVLTSSSLTGGLTAVGTAVTLAGSSIADHADLNNVALQGSGGVIATMTAYSGTSAMLTGTQLTGTVTLTGAEISLTNGALNLTQTEVNSAGLLTLTDSTGAMGDLDINGSGKVILAGENTLTSGAIDMEAEGTLSLTSNATLTGGNLTNAGTVTADKAAMSVATLNNSGSIRLANGAHLNANDITGLGNTDLSGTGTTLASAGDVALTTGKTSLSNAAILEIAAGHKLTVSGTGILELLTQAALKGDLEAGTGSQITLNNASMTGDLSTLTNSQVDLSSSTLTGNLSMNGGTVSLNLSTIDGNAQVTDGGMLSLTESSVTGNLTVDENGNLVINGANHVGGIFTSNGNVTMNGTITVTGESIIDSTLTINNTWTGNITINGTAGNVILASANGFIDGNIEFGTAGGTLTLQTEYTTGKKVTVTNDGTIALGDNYMAINGALEGTGDLTVTGTGTLALGNANTNFTGDIVMTDAGTLRLDHAEALNAKGTDALGTITAGGGATLLSTVTSTVNKDITSAGTLNVSANADTVLTVTGKTTVAGILHKQGNGNLILTGQTTTNTLNIIAGDVTITGAGSYIMDAYLATDTTLTGNGTQLHGITSGGASILFGNDTTGRGMLNGTIACDQAAKTHISANITTDATMDITNLTADLDAGSSLTGKNEVSVSGSNLNLLDTTISSAESRLTLTNTTLDTDGSTLSGVGVTIIGVNSIDLDNNSIIWSTADLTMATSDLAANDSLIHGQTSISITGSELELRNDSTLSSAGDISVTGSHLTSDDSTITTTRAITLTTSEMDLTADSMIYTEGTITLDRIQGNMNDSSLIGNDVVLTHTTLDMYAGSVINSGASLTLNGETELHLTDSSIKAISVTLTNNSELNLINSAYTAENTSIITDDAALVLTGSGTNADLGILDIGLKGSLMLDNVQSAYTDAVTNAGDMWLTNGSVLTVTDTLINTGSIDLVSSVLNTEDIANDRTITLKGESTLNGDGTFTQNGTGSLLELNDTAHARVTALEVNGGNVTLNGTSTMEAGDVTHTGGAITLNQGTAMTVTGGYALDGSTLNLNFATLATDRLTATTGTASLTHSTLKGDLLMDGASTVNITDQSLVMGSILLNNGGTLTIRDSIVDGSVTVNGDTTDAWLTLDNATINYHLTVTGNTTLTINNTNMVKGTSTITEGSTIIGNGTIIALNQVFDIKGTYVLNNQHKGDLTIADTGLLRLTDGAELTGNIILFNTDLTQAGEGEGARIEVAGSTGNKNFLHKGDLLVKIDGSINTVGAGDAYTLKGQLEGRGDLTKLGAGTLTLESADSAFSGDLLLQDGTLVLKATEALGEYGTLALTGDDVTVRTTRDITLSKDIEMLDGTLSADLDIEKKTTLSLAGDLDIRGELNLTNQGMLDITGDNSALNTVNIKKGGMLVSGRGNEFKMVRLMEGTTLTSLGDNTFHDLAANRGTILLDSSVHGNDTVTGTIGLADKSDLTIVEGLMDAAGEEMFVTTGSKVHFIDTTGVMGDVTLDGTDTAWDILNTQPSQGQDNGALNLTGNLESDGSIHMQYADMTVDGTTGILNSLLMENSLLNGQGAMTLGGGSNGMETTVTLDKSRLIGDTTLNLVNAQTTATESLIKGNELNISGGTTDLVSNSTLDGTTSMTLGDNAKVTLTDSTLNAGRLDIAPTADNDNTELTLNNSEMTVEDDMTIGGQADVTLNGSTGTAGGDLALNDTGSLTLDQGSDMTVTGGTSLTDDSSILVNDSSSLTTGSITANGNSSLTVTSGSTLEITSGAGETAINLDGNATMTITGTGKDETTPTLDTNGGDIVIGGSSDAVIKDALMDMDYDGTLLLKDTGTLTLTDTTIRGNVATEGDTDYYLTLENVTIKKDPAWTGAGERGGNLTVTGGNLTLIGDNVAEGTVSISKDASVTIKDGGSLSTDSDDDVVIVDPDGEINIGGGEGGGTLNSDLVLRGGDVNLDTGAAVNGDILYLDTDPAADQNRTVNVNDDFTLAEGSHLIVDTTQGENILNIAGDKTFTLAGNMAGDSTLELTGEGTLILNADNSETVATHGQHGEYEDGYTGDLILTGGGTIVLGADEAMGSEGALLVSDKDATLATEEKVSSSKDINVDGVDLDILTAGNDSELTLTEDALVTTSNEGSLTKVGSGTLTLDGTQVDIENLNLEEGTTNLKNIGGTFNNIEVTTITGEAILNITGSELDGDVLNVNGGITNLENSTLNLDITGTTGTINIGENVTVNGDITFDTNATGTNGMLINVNEDFEFGSDTYSLIVNDHGTINIAEDKTMTLNGHLAGTGQQRNTADITLTKDGEGKLIITTANTGYTGDLELKAGTIDVANSLDALGTGQLVSTGTSTINILAANGDTTLGNGITMDGDHTLTLNTEAETTVRNNTFTGTEGQIVKTGGERLILDHIRGAAMTGTALEIQEGNLYLTGTELGNKLTMRDGTVLEGHNSTVASVLAEKGSSVHLGLDKAETGRTNGYGELTVTDKMEMTSGSSFFVDLSGDNLRNDKVTVAPGGEARLNGATVVINDRGSKDTGKGAWKNEQRYQLVSADNVGSGFDWHMDGLYYLNAHLEQNTGGIDLVLTQNHKGAYGKTPNQTQISNALETIDNNGQATGELKDMLHAFEHTQSRNEAIRTLEDAGALGLTSMMNQQITGNLNHIRNINSAIGTGTGTLRQEFDGKGMFIGNTFTPQNQFWVQATGACSSIDNDGNGAGFDRNSWGAGAGYERSLSKEFLIGLAFSYEDADIKTNNPAASGFRYDSENIYFDLYAQWRKGPWQMKGLVGFSNADISLDRTVSVAGATGAGFTKRANGGTTGSAVNFAYELSYDFALNQTTVIQPLFTIESSGNSIKGYTESGTIGNAGLSIQDQDAWMTTLGLGARLVKDFSAFTNAPRGRMQIRALVTDSVGDQASTVDAAFIGAPETRYVLSPADQQRVGFLIGADFLLPVTNSTSIFAGGSAEFKGSDQNITGNLGVRYTF